MKPNKSLIEIDVYSGAHRLSTIEIAAEEWSSIGFVDYIEIDENLRVHSSFNVHSAPCVEAMQKLIDRKVENLKKLGLM